MEGEALAVVLKRLFIQFSDDGQHIRKWSTEAFEGGQLYTITKHIPADEWLKASNVGH